MRSPSMAVTRQGRSHDSMAVSGIFPSSVTRTRVHKESSIVEPLVGGAARSYTQTYPQVWITESTPGGLVLGSATTADQVATSHSLISDGTGAARFCTALLAACAEAVGARNP